MNIQTPSFRFQLDVSGQKKYEGETNYDNWLAVSIDVTTDGFSSSFKADVLRADFVRFAEQLASMEALIGQTKMAQFSGIQRDLDLILETDKTGKINGSLKLSNDLTSFATKFQMDQTYLQEIISDVQGILHKFPA